MAVTISCGMGADAAQAEQPVGLQVLRLSLEISAWSPLPRQRQIRDCIRISGCLERRLFLSVHLHRSVRSSSVDAGSKKHQRRWCRGLSTLSPGPGMGPQGHNLSKDMIEMVTKSQCTRHPVHENRQGKSCWEELQSLKSVCLIEEKGEGINVTQSRRWIFDCSLSFLIDLLSIKLMDII